MNEMSCFLLLAVLAAGCVSKDGTSVYCHPVFWRREIHIPDASFSMLAHDQYERT